MIATQVRRREWRPRGAASWLFQAQPTEVVLVGPAGTGKSRGCLEYIHAQLLRYPNSRALMLRKTLTSLTSTGLVTFREKVLDPNDGVVFFGGNKEEAAQYRYSNGSALVVGGLDKATKIMSSEYDGIFVQEAIELTVGEWESLTTRLRNGVWPVQQLVGDTNPDAPHHWLKQRINRGATVEWFSRHEDNPVYWDREQQAWTPAGAAYMAKLEALSGVRFLRLRKGQWSAAEGVVYDGWDRSVHLIDRFEIPADWPRFWTVDFGYTNPFVWQAWAVDLDGRLYRYKEIYRTQRLVEDHAKDILRATKGEPLPRAIICDHDAEGRATLERKLGIPTTPAYKAVREGIQAVASRLKRAGDGLPRLFLLRDSLAERDEALAEAEKPTCTEEEFDGYVWDLSANRKQGEEPVKEDDHGLDGTRYGVAHIDQIGKSAASSAPLAGGTRPAIDTVGAHVFAAGGGFR